MVRFVIPAGPFDLVGYRTTGTGQSLSVYIEGDGLAYLTPDRISRDPTPVRPVALELAARDGGRAVAYLARPCQYLAVTLPASCRSEYWTTSRFSPEVVAASNAAIDRLKRDADASKIRLIGYSGGGVVAALIAATRNDIDLLVTIGSPLDHRSWTWLGGYAPLSGSMDPMASAGATAHVRQVHLLGAGDSVVPPSAVRAYADAVRAEGGDVELRIVPDQDHWCCWPAIWPAVVRESISTAERESGGVQ